MGKYVNKESLTQALSINLNLSTKLPKFRPSQTLKNKCNK